MRAPFLVAASCGLAAALFVVPPSSHAQSKPPQQMSVSLTVAGNSVASNGPGECVASADASLYEVPGRMWNVRHKTGDVNFNLWRFSKGGDAATLFVTAGGKTHRVNTAQVGPASNRRGSGNATFTPNGTGGAFVLDFIADTGAEITGLITCSAFAKAEDNGR
jgi:hypothetical protein